MAPELDPVVQYGILSALVAVVSWLIKTLNDQTKFMQKLVGMLMGKLDDSNEVSRETALAMQSVADAIREHSDKTSREHNKLNKGFEVYKGNPSTEGEGEGG